MLDLETKTLSSLELVEELDDSDKVLIERAGDMVKADASAIKQDLNSLDEYKSLNDDDKILVERDGEMVKVDKSIISDAVAPDWNENNTESPNYIANRPFYKEDGGNVVILPEITVDLSDPQFYRPPYLYVVITQILSSSPYEICELDEEYIVEYNGNEYHLTSYYSDELICICIGTFSDNDFIIGVPTFGVEEKIPILLFLNPNTPPASMNATIKISKQSFNYHKISDKYLNGILINSGKNIGAEGFNNKNNVALGMYSHVEGGGIPEPFPLETIILSGNNLDGYIVDSSSDGVDTYIGCKIINTADEKEYYIIDEYVNNGFLYIILNDDVNLGDQIDSWEFTIEKNGNSAFGDCSHAEGCGTVAKGYSSHAEGANTFAMGECSYAGGNFTVSKCDNQHVFGCLNVIDDGDNYIEIVGNGEFGDNTYTRSNARTLDWQGNESLAGSITLGKGSVDEVTLTAAYLKHMMSGGGDSGDESEENSSPFFLIGITRSGDNMDIMNLNQTWQDIRENLSNGKICICKSVISSENITSLEMFLVKIVGIDNDVYYVDAKEVFSDSDIQHHFTASQPDENPQCQLPID